MKRGPTTLILSSSDIEKLIDMKSVIKKVRYAFAHDKYGIMPPKVYLSLNRGDFRAMPAFFDRYAGVKWVNVHPFNKSLPTVMATIVINEPNTGFPLAIMDGTIITDYRTGAAGGIATAVLSRKSSMTLGLIGCGRQAKTQFLAITLMRAIRKVVLYDVKLENAVSLMKYIRRRFKGKIIIAKELWEMKDCDVISTATPSREPVLMREHIKDGVHINAMGADAAGKQELNTEILKKARIFVDDIRQALHGGELNVPFARGEIKENNVYGTLGEVLRGEKKGRERDDEITVFDSTGIAFQDIVVAGYIYRKAKRLNVGREFHIF